ncbi:MAG: GntR family transcriptional regulator [Alphaproteobacteria bacterium]|nr:GntR family transcriptional regulator [Alphaproteobacteria bacterium]
MRQDIVAGALGLGSRLKLEDLARRYDTGHMPVREALRQLAGEGLVEIAPNRGARVRQVDVEFVHNLFDLRIAIEALLARRCAERIDAAQLLALEAAQESFEAHARRRDYPALLAANREFHDVMNRAARNPEASAMLERHWRLIAALWNRFGYGAGRVAGVISDHHQIIRALRARDAEVASCLAMAHAAKAKQELLSRMQAAAPVVAS